MNRKELKTEALNNLNKKWGSAIVNFLIFLFAVALLSYTGVGALLFSSLVTMGYMNVYYQGIYKNQYNPGDFVTPFNDNLLSRITLSIKKGVFIFLWSLLFVIPGIVKAYSYSMGEYLSLKHPDWDSSKCLDESSRMMSGFKFELFVLHLSFLGWLILSAFTFGILYIVFVGPYMNATIFNFYEKVYQIDEGKYLNS